MRAPRLAAAASAVLAIEGTALAVIALVELIGLGAGDAASLPTAIALIVLTLIAAGGLWAFSWGVRGGRSWARSGGVVLQVLAVVIALASLSLTPIPWAFVFGAGLPGLLGFALLIGSARREGAADHREPRED